MSILLNNEKQLGIIWRNEELYSFECSKEEAGTRIISIREDCYNSALILAEANRIKQQSNSCFLQLPNHLSTEVQIFGSSMVNPYYSSIEEFMSIVPNHQMEEQLLESINLAQGEAILWKLTGAFSILANLIEPMQLYREMHKNPKGLHQALVKMNTWLIEYAKEVLERKITVLSFADPMGSCELVGKEHFKSFVAKYQMELFASLAPNLSQSILHICGRNSVDLQKCGLIKAIRIPSMSDNYGRELIEQAKDSSFLYCGHGCIHSEREKKEWIWKITLGNQ